MRFLLAIILIISSIGSFGQPKRIINKKDTALFLPYKNGVAAFSYNGKMGVIDTSGKVVLPATFTRLGPLLDSQGAFPYFFCYNKKQVGILNDDFEVVIPIGTYDDIEIKIGGFFKVELDKKYAFVDTNGSRVTDWFDDAGYFRVGLANVKMDDKWGYIDTTGSIKISPKYTQSRGYCVNGLAAFTYDNKKWGFLNTAGEEVIAPKYDETHCFWNGLCAVKMNGLWGYINAKGETVIPFEYKVPGRFDNFGTACVKYKGKYIFIDKANNQIIEEKFFRAYGFHDNARNTLVKRKMFGRWIWINRKGECVSW